MRKIIVLVLIFAVFAAGAGLGLYIRNQSLNPKAAIPTIFSRLLAFFVSQGVAVEEDLLYYDTNITDFILNGSAKTKVSVEGKVDSVTREPDGDYHVVIINLAGLPLVTEFIPEMASLSLPKVGDKIKIWGIARFDEPHNWWELHPVVGWQKL